MNTNTEIDEVEAPQGFDDPCLERLTEAGLDKETDWNENSHKSLSKHQLEQKIKSYKKTFPGMTEKEIKEHLHIEESHPDDPAEESEEEGEEYDDDSSFDDSDEEGDSESEDSGPEEEESEGIQESFLSSGIAHAAGVTALVVAAAAGIGKFAGYLENKFGLGSESYVKMLENQLKAWKQELGEVDDYYTQEKRSLARTHEDEMRELTEEYKRERRYYTDFIEDAQEHLNKARAAYEAKKHKKQESVGSSVAKHAGDVAKTVAGGSTAGLIVSKANRQMAAEEAAARKQRKHESLASSISKASGKAIGGAKKAISAVGDVVDSPGMAAGLVVGGVGGATAAARKQHKSESSSWNTPVWKAAVAKAKGMTGSGHPAHMAGLSPADVLDDPEAYDKVPFLVKAAKTSGHEDWKESELPPISMIEAYSQSYAESKEKKNQEDHDRQSTWGHRSSAVVSGMLGGAGAAAFNTFHKLSGSSQRSSVLGRTIGGAAAGYAGSWIFDKAGRVIGGSNNAGHLLSGVMTAGSIPGQVAAALTKDKRKKEANDMNRFGVNSAQGDNEPIRESLASQRAGQLPSHLTASNFPAGSFSLHPQAAIPVSDDPMSLMWAQFNQHRAHAARGL